MEGKTLAEKLAAAKGMPAPVTEEGDSAGSGDEQSPVEAKESAREDAPQDANDTDAIVRAAKAMRGSSAQVEQSAAQVCLIVDDSRVIRKVSSKIAKSLGYVPIEAENGEEALARCKKSMPHLVLTDWQMPEMDGIEFVRQLRAIPTPKAPTIVFCTSKGDASDIHEGIGAGADDYIVKPFDEPALRAKLEKIARG
ncbi:MAG: response regulator [Pseudomonadota bacterium]